MRGRTKKAVARLAMNPLVRPLLNRLVRNRFIVLMLHRFADPAHGTAGISATTLRATFELLLSSGIPVLSLRQAVDQLRIGQPKFGVVFTVDDGYRDFATVGVPLFLEYRIPVTLFVTTGFLDRRYWFWWDKISLALAQTEVPALVLEHGSNEPVSLRSAESREAAHLGLVEWVKAAPEQQRKTRINMLLEALAVRLPREAPPGFEPLSWDEVRRHGAQGIDFAPHSVTHPTMDSLDNARMRREIRGSFDRLQAERADPLPVFCYPYGKEFDVSARTARAVAGEGMRGAVTAIPGYVGPEHTADPFMLPRFALPREELALRQIVVGLERLKELVRGTA